MAPEDFWLSADGHSAGFNDLGHIEFTHWNLMQFIGVHDAKGQPIYEGDIVEVCALHPLEPVFTTEVKWNTGSFTASKGRLYRTLAHWAQDGIEVIGNIHENPELLEQG